MSSDNYNDVKGIFNDPQEILCFDDQVVLPGVID